MCHLTRTSYISPEQVPEFLNPTELFWLYDSGLNETDDMQSTSNTASMRESKSGFQSKSACLFLFDGCLSKNKIRELVKNRIVESSVHLNKFERFKQRIMNLHSLGFVWIKCTTFNLDEHIFEIDNGINFETSEQMQVTAPLAFLSIPPILHYTKNHANRKISSFRSNSLFARATCRM